MLKRICWIALVLVSCTAADAQVRTTITNSTITVTNTFQNVDALNTIRQGCTIQNQGTHTMYVFFGPIASATTAGSIQVGSGSAIYCNLTGNGKVLQDEINITGTSGDAFVFNIQE